MYPIELRIAVFSVADGPSTRVVETGLKCVSEHCSDVIDVNSLQIRSSTVRSGRSADQCQTCVLYVYKLLYTTLSFCLSVRLSVSIRSLGVSQSVVIRQTGLLLCSPNTGQAR